MNKDILFNFQIDKEKKQIHVDRSFAAPLELVWAAWTEPDILDQWWAPKPYKTVTKSMNFSVGGKWLYYMLSPEGEKHWCLLDYITIQPLVSFSGMDAFCDEQGKMNTTKPRVQWQSNFVRQADETLVQITMQFKSFHDLETIIQMGFKEGFTAGLENLDQYISAQFYLRKQNKLSHAPRISTYLNFPGTTEEAFQFYKSAFKSDFINGIKRFSDLPQDTNQPPIAESVKQLVLHIELPILGGHILMGTDAPKEMGFNVQSGNNMYINLEPDTKEEAKHLYDVLSEEGEINMPLQDMFWGAYYGSFKDKYGINWMINFQHND